MSERLRTTLPKPGPYALTWQVHDALEALDMARARAEYHAERHPDLWSTEHITDWIDRAAELIAKERTSV